MSGHRHEDGGPASERSEQRWTLVLDAYEATLARQQMTIDAVAAGTSDAVPAPPTFVPPNDLDPLPDALAERAAALTSATRDLAAEARTVLAGLPVPTAVPRAGAAAGRSSYDRAL